MSGSQTERSHRTQRQSIPSNDPFRPLRSQDQESLHIPSRNESHTPHGPTGLSARPDGPSARNSVSVSHNPTAHMDGHMDGPGEESVERKYEKLKEKVGKRREDTAWWIWLSLLCHFFVLLWTLWLVGYVDTGLSCSRPLRGVCWACAIVIFLCGVSTALTQWHVSVVFRRFLATAREVVREEVDEEEDALLQHEKAGLTHQQTEMIVSRSLTDRMLYGCCTTCMLIMGTVVLFSLLLTLFIFTVIQKSDCHTTMPKFVSGASFLCLGLFGLFLLHIFVYVKLTYDFLLCYDIHFCEQNLIKEEVKIRP